MATPGRRSLNILLTQLECNEPALWPSHLCEAHKIVADLEPAYDARTVVIESVKLAHRCAQLLSEISLSEIQSSTFVRFRLSCKRIANCLKRTRLRREMRIRLDELAKNSFLRADVSAETISHFFSGCQKIIERSTKDANEIEILKYLGIEHNRRFGQLECKKRGDPTLPIVTWHEALSSTLKFALEANLRGICEKRQHQLTAHDVFRALANVEPDQNVEGTRNAKDSLITYVTQLARIWKKADLNVGRSSNAYDPVNLGPFPNFVERVLLSQFDANHNFFNRPDEERVWDAYQALAQEFKEATDEQPKSASRLITDRLLRQALALSKKIS